MISIDPERYLKSKPPPSAGALSKLPITLSCDIMVVQSIQEVDKYIKLKFEISLQWLDARVTYYNIKEDKNCEDGRKNMSNKKEKIISNSVD